MATAEVIAVGTELLLGEVANTNAAEISKLLADLGISVYFHSTVGDNAARLSDVLGQALARSDIVITTGGLGPTGDDITKEVVAEVIGGKLIFSPELWARMLDYFHKIHRKPTENNKKQAMVIEGSVPITNEFGTAPGVFIERNGKVIICLPGPPHEAIPMFKKLLPRLERFSSGQLFRRMLKLFGIGEAAVEQAIIDLTTRSNPSVATYVSPGEVHIRIAAFGEPRLAESEVANIEKEIRSRLGKWIFGTDEDTLEKVVGELLLRNGLSLATAESCTGGLVANRITDVPGSSGYFKGGIVAYQEAIKQSVLGVPEEIIREYGVVSQEVASFLADGVRRLCRADVGLAITGYAGPSGGAPGKPVGTVCLGLSGPGGRQSKEVWISGNRLTVKARAAQEALGSLWSYLKALDAASSGVL
ncbi:MAG TPA: competence/damage-inducible protein A [Firmicutes bacterium]|nr:competence/damage-inducible protein A [Bacillota bacterium]